MSSKSDGEQKDAAADPESDKANSQVEDSHQSSGVKADHRQHQKNNAANEAGHHRGGSFKIVLEVLGAILVAGTLFVQGWQLWVVRDQERRQLRAYVGIEDAELRCAACDKILRGELKVPPPGYRDTDELVIMFKNGGQTPSYDVTIYVTTYDMPLGQKLPANFTYTESPLSVDSPPVSHGSLNPEEETPSAIPLNASMISQFVRAQRHQITLYLFGHVGYIDVFGRRQVTPFCAEYDPDAAKMSERFIACPDHNTPSPD